MKMIGSSARIVTVVCLLLIVALAGAPVFGCTNTKADEEGPSSSSSNASSKAASSAPEPAAPAAGQSASKGYGLLSSDMVQRIEETAGEIESAVVDELEARENAEPIHVALGDEVDVTKNLAVRVVSVEEGPYDYADNGPTVKVTVELKNKTDKTLMVKASNINADSTDGVRRDHKLYIKDANGKRDTRSFLPTNISPGATFTGVVYFDGEWLSSVIYEPHFLISSQRQYIYWDCPEKAG